METIKKAMTLFGIKKDISDIERIGTGHINLTFKITYSPEDVFILQRINPNVFKEPEKIMHNISLICKAVPETPEFLYCGSDLYTKLDGKLWRAYRYVKNSICYDTFDDKQLVFEFGKAIGSFHASASTIDPLDMYETIKGFHDTKARLKKALYFKKDRHDDIQRFFEKALAVSYAADSCHGNIIAAHNDVKCSNVLFDKDSKKALMLIDLDTVMPGYAMYDFGDGARSACVTDGKADIEKYLIYREAYLSKYKSLSYEQCFYGTVCMTSELAARYYFDYVSGENYFSDKTPKQKIARCHELIKLACSFIEKQKDLL